MTKRDGTKESITKCTYLMVHCEIRGSVSKVAGRCY